MRMLAEAQTLTADSKWITEWIESDDFKSKEAFAKSLSDEGYVVKEISTEDQYALY